MDRCFVIQPFDGGIFDNRFEDVFQPALSETGLEAYRVDRDPGVTIPIQDIETGIRDARLCLADISLDNPNVWFELGYALASNKEVVLLCSDTRPTKFPFDVQHRSIIKYSTGSLRDFEALKKKIIDRVTAILSKERGMETISSAVEIPKVEGLEHHEITTLAAIAGTVASLEEKAAVHRIRKDMEKAGFNNIATMLALGKLKSIGLIDEVFESDQNGYEYACYGLNSTGWDWIRHNQSHFTLKRPQRPLPPPMDDFQDDIPF
ncbi:hypothetical protein [Xanthomonas theicola]|uniref:Uncharacterized protein n=1 Tax=Xanthomonas theicola TaxID=56464 RepID=A0A2S6Z0W2_9XANT|nr:hypothetical protein [Xanthomonas theicola]PPT74254.1 hypothetical protein XthCFBP4691_19985 [Xanthomonas theicola]QNH24982.1 hypothetical protein G4Q83_09830 [Xanthomonas theicola]